MSNLRLTIDLLPKGAWGNDFSKTLSKKDWDILRNHAYAKANHRCVICGNKGGELDAHEVWDFDIGTKTQTLKDIIALCPACHGVKHMHNSERIGYRDSTKAHFLKVNNCNQMVFAKHYAEQQFLFAERNKVLRWKVKADFSRFGGRGIEIKSRNIPLISDPYFRLNWNRVSHNQIFDVVPYMNLIEQKSMPFVHSIEVDNYQGVVRVTADHANKIQWICGEEIIKTKYNIIGRFNTTFSVENLEYPSIWFKLIGDGGETCSREFALQKIK